MERIPKTSGERIEEATNMKQEHLPTWDFDSYSNLEQCECGEICHDLCESEDYGNVILFV